MNPITPTPQPASTDLNTLKQNAYNASSNVQNLTTDAPSMLQQLKQNLVGIFAKDNPIIGARNDALSHYLSSPDTSRADLLPSNMGDVPGVPGRELALSPTQQNAIVASRQAAAFAPLQGLNEILKGQYGTIADLLSNAGSIYGSTISGAQNHANNLLDLYKTAVAEQQARNSAPINPLGDPMIMALLSKLLNPDTQHLGNGGGPSLDEIFGTPTGQTPTAPMPTLGGGALDAKADTQSATLAAPKAASSNMPNPTNFQMTQFPSSAPSPFSKLFNL